MKTCHYTQLPTLEIPQYYFELRNLPRQAEGLRAPPFEATNMSHLWHRPKTSDGNLLTPGHKVSFSDSSKSSNKRDSGRPSTASNSRPSSPAAPQQRAASQQRTSSSTRASQQRTWGDNRNFQRINRQSEALWQYVTSMLPRVPPRANHLQDPPLCLQQPHSLNLFSSTTTPSFPCSGPIRLFNF